MRPSIANSPQLGDQVALAVAEFLAKHESPVVPNRAEQRLWIPIDLSLAIALEPALVLCGLIGPLVAERGPKLAFNVRPQPGAHQIERFSDPFVVSYRHLNPLGARLPQLCCFTRPLRRFRPR